MGNRKKLRIGRKRNNSLREAKMPNVPSSGLMQIAGRLFAPDERNAANDLYATPDEMFAAGIPEDEQAKIKAFWANAMVVPASNQPVIKVVPAKHKGVTVGECYIHDDGQISLLLDKDAPQWALDEIKATANYVGFNIETGTPDGPA